MVKRGETIGSTGTFEKSGSHITNGISFIVFGIVILIIFWFAFSIMFVSNGTWVGDKWVVQIEQFYFIIVPICLITLIGFVLILGATFIYIGVKSKNSSYTAGKRISFWVLEKATSANTGIAFVAEIYSQNYCPKCNANLGSMNSRYCPECAADLKGDPEERKEWQA